MQGSKRSSVLEFCRGRREIIAVRGLSGAYKPRIAKVKSEKHGKRGDVLRHPRDGYFTVGIDSIKSSLFVDLSKDDPAAAGYIAFPSDCEDRLYQELVSEHRIAVKRLGSSFSDGKRFPIGRSNEMLDCYVYSQAAMARHGCTGSAPSGGASLRRGVQAAARRRCRASPCWTIAAASAFLRS